jgi:hypothetical protein
MLGKIKMNKFVVMMVIVFGTGVAHSGINDDVEKYVNAVVGAKNNTPTGSYQGQTGGNYTEDNFVDRVTAKGKDPSSVQFSSISSEDDSDVVFGGFAFLERQHIDFSREDWPQQIVYLNKHFLSLNIGLYPVQFYILLCLAFLGLIWPISFFVRKGIKK